MVVQVMGKKVKGRNGCGSKGHGTKRSLVKKVAGKKSSEAKMVIRSIALFPWVTQRLKVPEGIAFTSHRL